MARRTMSELQEVAAAVAVALVIGLAMGAFCRAEDPDADAEIAAIQEQMLERSNAIRAKRALKPHKASVELMAAAQDHARWMAKNRVFSHYANGGPGGRAAKYGFNAGVVENIGYCYQTVDQVFSAWGKSGGHYANMMSHTTVAGFGLSYAPGGTPYWCAVYGTPPPEPSDEHPEPTPPANLSPETQVSRPGLFGWMFGRRGR